MRQRLSSPRRCIAARRRAPSSPARRRRYQSAVHATALPGVSSRGRQPSDAASASAGVERESLRLHPAAVSGVPPPSGVGAAEREQASRDLGHGAPSPGGGPKLSAARHVARPVGEALGIARGSRASGSSTCCQGRVASGWRKRSGRAGRTARHDDPGTSRSRRPVAAADDVAGARGGDRRRPSGEEARAQQARDAISAAALEAE